MLSVEHVSSTLTGGLDCDEIRTRKEPNATGRKKF